MDAHNNLPGQIPLLTSQLQTEVAETEVQALVTRTAELLGTGRHTSDYCVTFKILAELMGMNVHLADRGRLLADPYSQTRAWSMVKLNGMYWLLFIAEAGYARVIKLRRQRESRRYRGWVVIICQRGLRLESIAEGCREDGNSSPRQQTKKS